MLSLFTCEIAILTVEVCVSIASDGHGGGLGRSITPSTLPGGLGVRSSCCVSPPESLCRAPLVAPRWGTLRVSLASQPVSTTMGWRLQTAMGQFPWLASVVDPAEGPLSRFCTDKHLNRRSGRASVLPKTHIVLGYMCAGGWRHFTALNPGRSTTVVREYKDEFEPSCMDFC